jgi:Na+/phosphate symporter
MMNENDRNTIDKLSEIQSYLDLVDLNLKKAYSLLIHPDADFHEAKRLVEYANFRMKRVIEKQRYNEDHL